MRILKIEYGISTHLESIVRGKEVLFKHNAKYHLAREFSDVGLVVCFADNLPILNVVAVEEDYVGQGHSVVSSFIMRNQDRWLSDYTVLLMPITQAVMDLVYGMVGKDPTGKFIEYAFPSGVLSRRLNTMMMLGIYSRIWNGETNPDEIFNHICKQVEGMEV